jgi:hypothetical protein
VLEAGNFEGKKLVGISFQQERAEKEGGGAFDRHKGTRTYIQGDIQTATEPE